MKAWARSALVGFAVVASLALAWAATPAPAAADCGPTAGFCGDGVSDPYNCSCGDSFTCGESGTESCGDPFNCSCGEIPDSNDCGAVDCGSCGDCSICPDNLECQSCDPCDMGGGCYNPYDSSCVQEPYCGDGSCDAGETYGNCAADCDSTCGDGYCDFGGSETCSSCPSDCSDADTSCNGCPDSTASNYSSAYVGCDGPGGDTSCCEYDYGCDDESADNYDPGASGCEGGGDDCCEYDGCTDSSADNYDPGATGCEDGTDDCCEYYGCTDELADNYDENATGCEDGGDDCCVYYGCPDPDADNYSGDDVGCEGGGAEDASCCVYAGCPDPDADNYDEDATGCDGEDGNSDCCEYSCNGDTIGYDDYYSGTYCCADDPGGWCQRTGAQDCRPRNECDPGPGNAKTPGGTCDIGATVVCAVAITNSCATDSQCDSCDPCAEPSDDCPNSDPNGPTCSCTYAWSYGIDLTCPSTVTGESQTGFTAFGGAFGASYDAPCPTEEEAHNAGQVAVFSQGNFCDLYDGGSGSASDFWFNVQSRDACLNIAGDQQSVPVGMQQDDSGNCTSTCPEGTDADQDGECAPDDQCPNFAFEANSTDGDLAAAGITQAVNGVGDTVCECTNPDYTYQASTGTCVENPSCPDGQQLCSDGSCAETCPPPDLCSNLPGTQAAVPDGMAASDGVCTCPTDNPKYCPDGPTYCIPADDCCSGDYQYCSINDTCYPTEDYNALCVGCSESNSACCGANPPSWCVTHDDTCYSNPQLTSACITAYDASGSYGQHGAMLDPLRSSATYTSGQIDAIFSSALADQEAAASSRRPIYGIVQETTDGGANVCSVTACDYGDACIDAANPTTHVVEATCVPAAQIATTTATTTGDVSLIRAAQIQVLPPIIPTGGQCLVLWTAQGMTSCSVNGPQLSVPAGDGSQFAGIRLLTPGGGSATYTISCAASDGLTYTASDSCSTNPNINEF